MMKKIKIPALVFLTALFFVLAGMWMNIVPVFTKPADRGYNGLQGFTDDYIGYVSYVKEGIYGRNTFRVRSLPPGQTSTSAQLILIVMGKIGGLFGWDAPLTYHIFRGLFGFIFFISMYILFRKLVTHPTDALIGSIFAALSASVGWYVNQNGIFLYNTFSFFGFTDNVALRFSSRPHYLLGAALFIVLMLACVSGRKIKPVWIIGIFLASVVLASIHPTFALLFGSVALVMVVRRILIDRSVRVFFSPYTAAGLGLIAGLASSYWSTHQYPYTYILAFEEYVRNENLSLQTIVGDCISFGPMLWIGLPGLVHAVIKTRGRREKDVFMLLWLVIQLSYFFILYKYFRTERVRYIQSLYFIPMAYGTLMLFRDIAARTKPWIFWVLSALLLASVSSTFVYGFLQSMYYHTNYKNYSLFVFPTKPMMEAYAWLNRYTPKESVVIAGYEAANNIIVFSHNYVIGNKQGWPEPEGTRMEKARDAFYLGVWNESAAHEYLRKLGVSYVYNGYQEPDGIDGKYKFLTPVFRNSEVIIYKVD